MNAPAATVLRLPAIVTHARANACAKALREALRLGDGWLTFVALGVGALTLYSMTKIWKEAFWKAPPETLLPAGPWPRLPLAACLLLAAVTVAISLHPQPLIEMAELAAQTLVSPQIYVDAVMKGGPGS